MSTAGQIPTRALPAVALGIALLLTLAAWGLSSAYVSAEENARFQADADQFEAQLRERMGSYQQVLLGGVALFDVSGGWVLREQWHAYFETLKLERRFPGIQGFGFVERVAASNLTEHEERVRGEGFPQYTVFPSGVRAEYAPVLYLEPLDARNQRAFGFDMASDDTLRAAMDLARDTGEPTLSGAVRLVQENGTDVQPGFVLYVPVYLPGVPHDTVEARREALVGFVHSPFRARDFMRGLQATGAVDVGLRIYDGDTTDPQALIYARAPESGVGDLTRTRSVTMANHEWTLVESSTAAARPPGLALLPLSVLLGGALASALAVSVVWALTQTRVRAERLANEMTARLQARSRELEESNDALRAFSYVVSHDLKEPVRGMDAYLRVLHEDHGAELSPEARSLVERAQNASARMGVLLRGLLELSRVDRGLLQARAVSVHDVLAQDACRSAYETLEHERGARIEVERVPPVLAVPSVLAQALGNLVANAIRHNPGGAPRVLVHGARSGDLVEVVVEDDGAGYPPGFVEAFNRGGHPASGFGLLIAQRAVDRLNGRLVLGRGERLGGAQARLILPAAPATRRTGASGDESGPPPRTRGSTSASR